MIPYAGAWSLVMDGHPLAGACRLPSSECRGGRDPQAGSTSGAPAFDSSPLAWFFRRQRFFFQLSA